MNGKIQCLEAELQRTNLAGHMDLEQRLDVLNQLVWELRNIDPVRALDLSKTAYELAQRLDYVYGRLLSLRNLTILYTHIFPKHDIALGWANQALQILENHPVPPIQAYLFQCLATIHRHLSDYAAAHDLLVQGLALCQEAEEQDMEGMMYNDLGVLYRYTNDCEKALAFYQQSLRLARECGNQDRESRLLNNIGELLNYTGHPDEAFPYLEQSLSLAQALGIKTQECLALDSLSEVYIARGNYTAALTCLHRAKQLAEEVDNKFELSIYLRNIARIYEQQQDGATALVHLHQALAAAEVVQDKLQIFLCHQLLAQIYETHHDLAKALWHYKQFHTVKEEIFNEQADKKLKTLQVIHETEAAKREAAIYRFKNIELQTALDQVKQLSGLLPICSGCKKIRDDSGYWQDVAIYISSHSEAAFSHGICPDCRAHLYPKPRKADLHHQNQRTETDKELASHPLPQGKALPTGL